MQCTSTYDSDICEIFIGWDRRCSHEYTSVCSYLRLNGGLQSDVFHSQEVFIPFFPRDIRTWNIFVLPKETRQQISPRVPISEIYTTEWFHIPSVFSVTTCSTFFWGLILVRPFCSTPIFFTSITGQETKTSKCFPHHWWSFTIISPWLPIFLRCSTRQAARRKKSC